MQRWIAVLALVAVVAGTAAAQENLRVTHRKVDRLAPPEYQEVMLGFVGDDFSTWTRRTVDGKECWISPRISPPTGYEMNHHRVAVDYAGSGSVEVSIAHSTSDNLNNALAKRHLHSKFQAVKDLEEVTVTSRYKGEDNIWILLHPAGGVDRIQAVRYTFWQGENALYGHLPGQFEHKGGTLNYRLMYPRDYNPRKQYPLVISVAGSGGVGDENRKSMEMVILARHLFTRYYDDEDKQCFSLVPQVPPTKSIPEGYWPHNDVGGPVPEYHPGYVTVNADGWYSDATLALVEDLTQRLPIDEDRIYVTGFSLGGKAVYELLKAGRDVFAAGASGAGWAIGGPFGNPTPAQRARLAQEAERYKHIPVYIFAGEKDRMRSSAQAAHEAITRAGGTSRYFEVPGADHVGSAGHGWLNEEHIDWLFQQRRKNPGPDPYPDGNYPEPEPAETASQAAEDQ